MLQIDEKNRIRDEEIFRQEIRREIEVLKTNSSSGKRIWSLLNSSFALWFLSSVVLGSLTAAVTTFNARSVREAQRAEIQRRLNTEISSRIQASKAAMRVEEQKLERGQQSHPSWEFSTAWHYLNNTFTYDGAPVDFSIYPEYQKRSFQSLVYELSTLAGRETLPAILDAQRTFRNLEQLADQAEVGEDQSSPADKNAALAAARKSIEILQHLQSNSFWQTPL
ncbi:MAG TPA: hypothetical protein VGR47_05580 [Terracidiphilus sp.]|nr:hypothetical protein [Terracidiphilus sp.]